MLNTSISNPDLSEGAQWGFRVPNAIKAESVTMSLSPCPFYFYVKLKYYAETR